VVRNPCENTTAVHGEFTIPRAALELGNATGAKVFKV
jgi:hypothetical protein